MDKVKTPEVIVTSYNGQREGGGQKVPFYSERPYWMPPYDDYYYSYDDY